MDRTPAFGGHFVTNSRCYGKVDLTNKRLIYVHFQMEAGEEAERLFLTAPV